jgi:hypothetical protein
LFPKDREHDRRTRATGTTDGNSNDFICLPADSSGKLDQAEPQKCGGAQGAQGW